MSEKTLQQSAPASSHQGAGVTSKLFGINGVGAASTYFPPCPWALGTVYTPKAKKLGEFSITEHVSQFRELRPELHQLALPEFGYDATRT